MNRPTTWLLLLFSLAAPAAASDDALPLVPGVETPSSGGAAIDLDAVFIGHPDSVAPELAAALRLELAAPAVPGSIQVTATSEGAPGGAATSESKAPPPRRLPFLGEAARQRGYALPPPFGAGAVFYYLSRDIDITAVRLGRDGSPLAPVGDFVDLGARADVTNVNVKFDVWVLPFLNLYAIAGYVWNEADTRIEIELPPLLPGGAPRRRELEVPTTVEGSIGGLGLTLAGGYKSFFAAADLNAARADLGFDDVFDAVVASLRAGWNGELRERPLRLWFNATYWDTFATAKGTVADPDGGTLAFEVDQGPRHPWTYGVGAQCTLRPWLDLAADYGTDLHGGWYVAVVPVIRF